MRSAFKKHLLFVLFLILSGEISAQRSAYYIKNYTPQDYEGYNQMWQATQDKNGLIYFACTSHIFVFDGTSFQSILVKPGSANRQISIDSTTGTIYVGAVGEFGYLQRDSTNGILMFKSMTGSLNEDQKIFSDIWKVFVSNGKVYFQSSERIFVCKGKKVIGTIEASREKGFALMFESNGRLFVRQRNQGLMEIVNDKLQLCPGGERFGTIRLLGLMPWKNGANLVLSGDSGFYVMETKSTPGSSTRFFPLSEKPDTFLIKHGVLGLRWVNDSTFAVFTRTGIGFFNRDVELVECLNKSSGLGDESVAEIFVDRQKNVWAMHNNGISRISYNIPALYLSDQSGYSGTIEWMIRHQGKLYLATTEGLFRESTDASVSPSKINFIRVGGLPLTEVWHLLVMRNMLFIGTSNGLFYMHDNVVEKISDHYVNRICESPNPDEFIVIEKGGLSVYGFIDGQKPKLIKHYVMPGEDNIRTGKINFVKENNVESLLKYEFWSANRFKEIVHVAFDLMDTNITVQYYDSTNGLPTDQIYIVVIGDTSYFFTGISAYRYVGALDKGPGSKCFFRAPKIFDLLFDGNYEDLNPPFDFSLFLQKSQNALTTFFGENGNMTFFRSRLPVSYCFGGVELQFALAESSGISWLASGTVILRYDSEIKPPSDLPFNTIISKVIIGNDSTIFYGSDNINFTKQEPLPYNFNSIAFKFSAPYFELDGENYYYYKLEGFDTGWTEIKTRPEKSYMNLPEGDYTFMVKARNLHGRWSSTSTYAFTILPPWYRSSLAYVGYVLLFFGIIIITVKLSVRRLKKAKDRLEQIVTERTAEVVEQKLLLEEKHKEITDSINYAERIQRSFLASEDILLKQLHDYFIFFKPKDVVSGDFYWAGTLGNGKFVLATADSTGHGVPGAIMSILNISCLERVMIEGVSEPGEILDRTRFHIINRLKKDGSMEGGKDGMDCSLIVFDFEKKKLQYAAAHNPILLIRNGIIIELSADKMPVGKHDLDKISFKSHFVDLENGDMIYTFTDGFADQFGGPKGKKFMYKNLKALLKEISFQQPEEQKSKLIAVFDEWKRNNEQVDDVLVIGFRVKF